MTGGEGAAVGGGCGHPTTGDRSTRRSRSLFPMTGLSLK